MDHNRKVVELPLDDILPNRFQPRIKFNEESIIELSESIKEHGVIQPIVVRPVGDKYEIIAGERRYKASCMAGLEKIPALVTDLNDKDSAEVALIENVQRKDLTPIEEAISYKKILDMGYLTQEKLAEKLGKKQSTVANKLRLLNLDEDVQEAILEDKISERHARSILKLQSAEDQKKILKKIIDERLTVRKTDEVINKMLNGTYEEVQQPASNEPVKEETINDTPTVEAPFDFSKLDFLQSSPINPIMPDEKEEEHSTFEIPKFEDLLVEEHSIPEIEEAKSFDIPKFEDLLSDAVAPKNSTEETLSTEELVSKNVISPVESIGENLNGSSDLLTDVPTPFVFDNLFLDNSQTDLDVVEIPENIEFIDDLEEVNESEKVMDLQSSFDAGIMNSSNNVNLTINNNGNNTYVASDFKTVINTIRNCAETIEKYGFKINVEELELAGEYKVTFTVKK